MKMSICSVCGNHEEIVKVVKPSTMTFEDGFEIEIEGRELCFSCNEFEDEEYRIMVAEFDIMIADEA